MAAPQQDYVTGHVTNQRANRGPISAWTTWAGGQLGGLLPRTPVPRATPHVPSAPRARSRPRRRAGFSIARWTRAPRGCGSPDVLQKKKNSGHRSVLFTGRGRLFELRRHGLSACRARRHRSHALRSAPGGQFARIARRSFDVAAVTAKGDRGTGEEVVSRILYRCATGYGSTGGRVAVTVRS